MIEITRPPPFMTVQDLGRQGLRSKGIPPSGAMDRDQLAWGNLLIGNPADAAGLEWALGAGTLTLSESRPIVGVGAPLTLNGVTVPSWTAVSAQARDEVVIGLPHRRFGYLAVGGGVDLKPVLGSRSTYLVAGFGGLEGRRLRKGDRLPLGLSRLNPETESWRMPAELSPRTNPAIRIVPGPQSDLFDDAAWESLLSGQYSISAASDRMGYRLDGPPLKHQGKAALPSEPVCPGAIQVPDGGAPIVLMPDGPTVGGYPKLAVIISADMGAFAQSAPGTQPRFELVTFEEAVAALRDRESRLQAAEQQLRESEQES